MSKDVTTLRKLNAELRYPEIIILENNIRFISSLKAEKRQKIAQYGLVDPALYFYLYIYIYVYYIFSKECVVEVADNSKLKGEFRFLENNFQF